MSRIYQALERCEVCPQNCRVNRYRETGFCGADHRLKINLAHLHHGEEPVLSGSRGSGTIFFSHCNLRCVYCQNHRISHQGWGTYYSEEECAGMMLELQAAGGHNVNLVSPTHYTPQLAETIRIAKGRGLRIPVVWNSNAYENVSSLRSLKGLVDIYLPDFKYADAVCGSKYSQAGGYPDIALKALREMHAQVGELEVSPGGIARRGVLIRHLVLPNRISGTTGILRTLRDAFGTEVSVSLMAQYYPAGEAAEFPELDRGLLPREYQAALDQVEKLGLNNVFTQELNISPEWTPDFAAQGQGLNQEDPHFRGKENYDL